MLAVNPSPLAAAPDVASQEIARRHVALGDVAFGHGDLTGAAARYSEALRLMPTFAAAWCNLGSVYMREGRPTEAITSYMQALALNPAQWAARSNLVEALIAIRNFLVAKALLQELSTERPQDATLRARLGKLCHDMGELQPAIEHFAAAVTLNPNDHESVRWIGGIYQKTGDLDAAYASYLRAEKIQLVVTRPARTSPAAFCALALFDPFGGNIPTEYLLGQCAHDTNTLALLSHGDYDADRLRSAGDIVINLISDADQAAETLARAADLVDRLGKPVINHPRQVLHTRREDIVERLKDIPHCRVPKLIRWHGTAGALKEMLPSALPILARPAGSHGGDEFEKFDELDGLIAFVDGHSSSDCYVSEYVDYRSADGYFRKYRFIFVDDQILPYHLAICDHWKVHHDNTDMADHAWMQAEEAAFLGDPLSVFTPTHFRALRIIQERIGLDYFGIDCSFDDAGDLLVFEVNACMLVHDQNADFPYKAPFVRKIKSAFDAMLAKTADKAVHSSH